MYNIEISSDAVRAFRGLEKAIQLKIQEKIDWLAENANTVTHYQLSFLPDKLKGLCRLKAGDYRILYFIYHAGKRVSIYLVEHRSVVYKILKDIT
ncbi:MAG: type II toxin-antitoxin system RelE/ParE family toxin [Candidatus Magnetobacterium sp. LHC-1]|uniref:Type II toxin-antitoxin system RelE/ParE family toxin n=1 Tax=Candidatus Magnetobacterium casense TaxID=1455061 RepID=A0ABS6RU39_9BACT|nr:type II toxin-antitoxin system RelE/ParE family toxin [Candidatus Magnetobacterium casensis]MBV6339967.1 type II toxin-antitoxin system RelE/ParE family toxin [Candidatus Magnetobacterium casensis]